MSSPGAKPAAQITIPIHVETSDQASGEREGTFKSPWPKLRVALNDKVRWQIGAQQNFTLDFGGNSPFAESAITDSNFHTAVNKGIFHYTVAVTDHGSGKTWKIDHCPEFEVGDNS
jgi:hypothetical protein